MGVCVCVWVCVCGCVCMCVWVWGCGGVGVGMVCIEYVIWLETKDHLEQKIDFELYSTMTMVVLFLRA